MFDFVDTNLFGKASSISYNEVDVAFGQMLKITEDLTLLHQNNKQIQLEAESMNHEVLITLSTAAKYHDEGNGVHVVRLAYMAERLSILLGESDEFSLMLRLSSPMHDIGKIGIPKSILNNSEKLNEYERIVMNTHSAIGYNILGKSSAPFLNLQQSSR